ncbi:Fic family protein [Rhodanobacter sp. DHG33]|uniref:Fic family protein n=1 Tax=Rhodanobacter sp. DHG33 TaxID=2775921 RepID=UPI001782B04C|nr:Fic family protein [Rhodanobacter sp. DHG33]MBD8897571.1 Fic family protein [Rhodanobacter sp. DHG33]
MKAADFHAPQAGRVVRTAAGHPAFVPAPLPPELAFDLDLVRVLSRADAALSELSGHGALLPNPHLLIAPYLRREAVLSSRIEGTQTSLADLLADEAGQDSHVAPDDVREVRNYVTALEHGVQRLGALPLSLRLVRELHETLLQGVRGNQATPGEFRARQNWIGPPGSTEATATYVPPPVPEMKQALADWEKFLHQRDTLPELVQCALMHEQFETIHPFLDGNGRVGRLLITLFLIERGRLSQPLLYLSEYIERHKQGYYDALQRVRTHGAWSEWLRYFLEGVCWSAARAARQARELMALREQLRRKVAEAPKSLALIDELFVNPYINTARAKGILNVTDPTARSAIAVLEKAGIVREATGRAWGKMYLAQGVLKAIEQPKDDDEEH